MPLTRALHSILRPVRLLGAAALLTVTAGCSQDSDPAAGPSNDARGADSPRVALVMKSLANEFFTTMAEGARKHQAAQPDRYQLLINGIRNESDLSQQVALVEQMMASGVDVIVLAPADSQGLLPVARRAVQQGIVVINIDNRFDAQLLAEMGVSIPFVGPDNREGARRVGEELAKTLAPGAEVAIIGGVPGAFNARERQAGFEQAMQAAGVRVVSVQAADWEQARAASTAGAILREHPKLAAFLCANDSMALGAVAAVRQAGRSGQIAVVGFDNISAARSLIEAGDMLATAEQYGDQLAVFGIEYALQILEQGSQPEDKQTPVDVITAASLR